MADGPIRIQAQRNQGAICPFCREGAQGLAVLTCPDCGTAYHRACAEELGGCATLGCRGAEIGRLRLRLRWRHEDHHGFLSRWDRPARERGAPARAPSPAQRPRRISTWRLAWMQLDVPRLVVGMAVGLFVLGMLSLASIRAGEAGDSLVGLGVLLLAYFTLSGGYGVNPWWWPNRRREWWE